MLFVYCLCVWSVECEWRMLCRTDTVHHHKSLDINFWVCYVKSLRKELPFAVADAGCTAAVAVATANFHSFADHVHLNCQPTDVATSGENISVFFTPLPFFVFFRRRLTHTHTRARHTRYDNGEHIENRSDQYTYSDRLVFAEPTSCLTRTRTSDGSYRFCCRRLLFFVWFMGG